MKQEIAMAWADLLRSGKYQQGRNALMEESPDGVRHCCLNVLNLLAQDNGVAIFVDEADRIVYWDSTESEIFTVPAPVQEWAGMQSQSGMFDDSNIRGLLQMITGDRDTFCNLSNCNDLLNMNFDQIAELIDTYWEEL